jgi:C-methyltransferase.
MQLYDIEKVNIHGGSLRCYIKNSQNNKESQRCKKILSDEIKNLNLKAFNTFNKEIFRNSKILKEKLINLKKKGFNIIGYGCPARVSTITNVSNIDSALIKYIIDDSPLKQNRFTPGMHIKILPRKGNLNNKINIVIVFAYEYFKDIKKFFRNKKVNFYKPIPFSKL